MNQARRISTQTHLELGHHGQHRGPALARGLLLGLLFRVSRKQHFEQGVLGLLQEPGQLRGDGVLWGKDKGESRHGAAHGLPALLTQAPEEGQGLSPRDSELVYWVPRSQEMQPFLGRLCLMSRDLREEGPRGDPGLGRTFRRGGRTMEASTHMQQ